MTQAEIKKLLPEKSQLYLKKAVSRMDLEFARQYKEEAEELRRRTWEHMFKEVADYIAKHYTMKPAAVDRLDDPVGNEYYELELVVMTPEMLDDFVAKLNATIAQQYLTPPSSQPDS